MLCLVGCDPGGRTDPPVDATASDFLLTEVASLYEMNTLNKGKPPRRAGDLKQYSAAFPMGYIAITGGDVVAFWGVAPLQSPEAASTVLAYEKKAPDQGGAVLMLDGKTVKTLTAEEFQAAPKAGPDPPVPAKKKA